jgi:hypothetical protein
VPLPNFDMPQVSILSYPRSGTHLLQSLLASHPHARGRGECFLRYERQILHSKTDTKQYPVHEAFFNDPQRLNIGIIMYPIVDMVESYYGPIEKLKLIHLTRDPLSAALSKAQMEANRQVYRNLYESHFSEGQDIMPNQPFSDTWVHKWAASVAAQQRRYVERLKGLSNVFTVTYEAITHNQETHYLSNQISAALLRFLELDVRPLRTSLIKTGLYSDK